MNRPALDAEMLRTRLAGRWAAVEVVTETASTNADLLARHELADRTVLVAEHQSAGRGRLDRTWASPPLAGLTFSAAFRPGVPLVAWGWLPLLAGVALAEAVQAVTGVEAALKWPNDLLVGERKAAGILVQTAADAVVVGIGLNVSTTAEELPVDTATSLALAGAGDVDRTALLAEILTRLDAREAQWDDVRGDAEACGLAAVYRERCATLGARVRVTLPDRVLEGDAVDLDPAGRLVVRAPDGEHAVGAGDVEQLRRTG